MKALIVDMDNGHQCLGSANFEMLPDQGDSLIFKWKREGKKRKRAFVVRHRRFVAADNGGNATMSLWCMSEESFRAEMEIFHKGDEEEV